jgi:uncharacterized protein (TIGR03086 family)
MTDDRVRSPLSGGVALLERAINYTLGALHLVTPADMACSTPCRDWDLRALLEHLDDSLMALHEALDTGCVDLDTGGGDRPFPDPVAGVRDRARRLLGACAGAYHRDLISVGGCPMPAGIVTGTGALEVAVHGWDVTRAGGRDRPIPQSLATEILALSPLLVTEADRPTRFAAPVEVASPTGPADLLIAFLGRTP